MSNNSIFIQQHTRSFFGNTLLTSKGCVLTANCKGDTTCCNSDLCNGYLVQRPTPRLTSRRVITTSETTARPTPKVGHPSDIQPLKSIIPEEINSAQSVVCQHTNLLVLSISTITCIYFKLF